jgi:hypothetical protein
MKPEFEKRLRELAIKDARRRKDPRFLDAMGFLIAKGLLGYNRPIPEKPNAKLDLRATIWAGQNVEPRILEVLPAAFTRLERHFIVSSRPNADELRLIEIREMLRTKREDLPDFLGIPFEKYRAWLDFPLRDGRTRILSERKRMKAFRLRPETIERLAVRAAEREMSEAEILEELIGKYA